MHSTCNRLLAIGGLHGRHRRLENPSLEEILEIIDETEDLVWTRRKLRGC
jgi:hypothetical protein